MNDPELSPDVIVKWLESKDGEWWSEKHHETIPWQLAIVKDDVEPEDSFEEISVILWYA